MEVGQAQRAYCHGAPDVHQVLFTQEEIKRLHRLLSDEEKEPPTQLRSAVEIKDAWKHSARYMALEEACRYIIDAQENNFSAWIVEGTRRCRAALGMEE